MDEIMTKISQQIRETCGFKNSEFILSLILLNLDTETWTVDKSILTRIYQAIDIVEKNEELKKMWSKQKVDFK